MSWEHDAHEKVGEFVVSIYRRPSHFNTEAFKVALAKHGKVYHETIVDEWEVASEVYDNMIATLEVVEELTDNKV